MVEKVKPCNPWLGGFYFFYILLRSLVRSFITYKIRH